VTDVFRQGFETFQFFNFGEYGFPFFRRDNRLLFPFFRCFFQGFVVCLYFADYLLIVRFCLGQSSLKTGDNGTEGAGDGKG